MTSKTDREEVKSTGELVELMKKYSKHWKWFVLSVVCMLSLGYFYIKYTVPSYGANATIQIIEEKSSSFGAGGVDVFQDLGILSGSSTKIEDEVEVLGSRSHFLKVMSNLKLNISIYNMGVVKDSEIYQNKPVRLTLEQHDSIINNSNYSFYIEYTGDTNYKYYEEEGDIPKEASFGSLIDTPIGEIIITPDVGILKYKGKQLKVVIQSLDNLYNSYISRLKITPNAENSNIINLNLTDPVQEKAKDILNELIDVYNKSAIEDKKNLADQTSKFIETRIDNIYSALSDVDQSAEDFKAKRGLTDVASEANINLNIGATNQQELMNANTQLSIASSMKEIVTEEDGYDPLPSNLGLSDPTIAGTTERYNQLALERKRLLKSADEKNPMIVNLDQQLNALKNSLESSLQGMENNLSVQVNNLSSQRARINSKIYSSPKNERALRDISRKQQTTESLYLYLLQKSEEAQITYASSPPKSKILEHAYNVSPLPVAPKKQIIYLVCFILGFTIPFSVIYANQLLDNKIHNKVGLEKIIGDIPVLAELPKLGSRDKKVIFKDDRSVLAESLRILRTNLDYLINSSTVPNKNVVYVTSSVPGEGKTFVSSNLAMILASTGKRVLLVGADIRNPKIQNFFSGGKSGKAIKSDKKVTNGLTEYLFDHSLQVNQLIDTISINDNAVDVVYSGKIPPNPAEMLMSERFGELIVKVSKEYDYVILDTAPVMVVTDTLLISKYAGQTIYVTRAGVTETKIIEHPLKLKEEGKLKNLSFVVNDVKDSNLGYGGKYGYGYGKTLKKWWKF